MPPNPHTTLSLKIKKGKNTMKNESSVEDEILNLVGKMKYLAVRGESKIECRVVLESLYRIEEFHHKKIEDLMTTMLDPMQTTIKGK